MRYLLIFLSSVGLTGLSAQPATEIWLMDLRRTGSGIHLGNPVNISAHPGYDNQPSFHPKRPILYYSSARADGRTDILAYDWKKAATTSVTLTTEREYSPTVTPDRRHLSCIIQRDNGAQDLGQYPLTGGDARVLIDNLIVGYHAWLDATRIIAFVLGQPQTLRMVDLTTGKDRILADSIGRSIHRIPGTASVSFVDKSDAHRWRIRKVNPDLTLGDVALALPQREDIAWLPDGHLISSDGERVMILMAGADDWQPVPGFTRSGITRIAVSADGKKLAVVAAE